MFAYCWASGVIGFTPSRNLVPEGAIGFTDNVDFLPDLSDEDFVAAVKVKARLGRTHEDFLVPGVPEADNQREAGQALERWVAWAFPKAKAE